MRATLIATSLILVAAAPAAAEETAPPTSADGIRATVHHVPPSEAYVGAPLRLVAVIDDAWREAGLVARYRPIGADTPYAQAAFERSSAGGYFATIPAESVGRPGLEYYIVGVDGDGDEVVHFADEAWPHPVRVEPEPNERWIEAEIRRIEGRRSVIRTHVQYLNFGGIEGVADQLYMAELDWSYRMVGTLYKINLGFGGVQGKTPDAADDPSMDPLEPGVRYGYGGMRVRLHRRIWVDGRAVIGWGKEGFVGGGGGALVLGRDWGTSVVLGAEYIEELGLQAKVRLQWDTVPPMLMGVEVVTTDWPDANVKSGSYIAYDVGYPVTDQLRLVGQLSYGARGNRPGGLGAGLGTTFEF